MSEQEFEAWAKFTASIITGLVGLTALFASRWVIVSCLLARVRKESYERAVRNRKLVDESCADSQLIGSLTRDRDNLLKAVTAFIDLWKADLSDDALGPLHLARRAALDNVGKQWCPRCQGVNEDEGRPITAPLCVRCEREDKEDAAEIAQKVAAANNPAKYFDLDTLLKGGKN